MNVFTWIPFYQELSSKILTFRNNQKELTERIHNIFVLTGLKDNLIVDGKPFEDVDPFTVMGTFNRGLNNNNRVKLLKGYKEVLDIQSEVPNDFNGIPVMNAMLSWFASDRDGEDVINDYWDVFEYAIKYADSRGEQYRDTLASALDKVVRYKNTKWNITMGLFWIRPYWYINLDKQNRQLLEHLGLFDGDFPTGNDYLKLCDDLRNSLGTQDLEYKNFPELSNNAWKNAKTTKEDTINNYWWLNANPEYFNFDKMEIGEEQEWTLYNENGNKRRIFKNFLQVKAGDKVIGYESTPVAQIVAIGIFTDDQNGEFVNFKKEVHVSNGVSLDDIRNNSDLQNMEFLRNPQGSLFKLTKKEFETIQLLIDNSEQEPAKEDTSRITAINNKSVVATKIEKYSKEDFINEVFLDDSQYEDIKRLLLNKKNIILQGPPGVGKTFTAKRLAYSIMGCKDDYRVGFIQFHQNYSYEDFVMGYRPTDNGFALKDGIFYKFCKDANESLNVSKNHNDNAIDNTSWFFIIDEINRGNLSKIFGELLVSIESDYRGKDITLAYDDGEDDRFIFNVPENVYIIGMMNTADRGLALIDYALRRRFSFVDMKPAFESKSFIEYQNSLNNMTFNSLIENIKSLNNDIINDESLGEGFCIGHSYFCNLTQETCTDDRLLSIVQYDILPTLKEYWFDNKEQYNKWKNNLEKVFK